MHEKKSEYTNNNLISENKTLHITDVFKIDEYR